MSPSAASNRRRFLRAVGSSIAGSFSFLAFSKIGKAATAKGIFASQFLEEGRVIDLPAGYYDPEQKEFIFVDSDGSSKFAQRMSGIGTCRLERRCLYTDPNSSKCGEYVEEWVRHPDGFSPNDQGDEVC